MELSALKEALREALKARAGLTTGSRAANLLDQEIAAYREEISKRAPLGQRRDNLRSVISRTARRISEAESVIKTTEKVLANERAAYAKHQEELTEVEAQLHDEASAPTSSVPPQWVANKVSRLIEQISGGHLQSREALLGELTLLDARNGVRGGGGLPLPRTLPVATCGHRSPIRTLLPTQPRGRGRARRQRTSKRTRTCWTRPPP